MAYNPQVYFPQNYQPQYPQYQPVQQQPTGRMVEVIPVDNESVAVDFPVSVGSTVEFMAKDDSFVAFKTVEMNGQSSFAIYDLRPPAPPAPAFDPSAYVRRDEIDALVAAVVAREAMA